MQEIDVNKILFRCSSLGYIMTEEKGGALTATQIERVSELQGKQKRTPNQEEELKKLLERKDKPPGLSETTKIHLIDKFVSVKYGRESEIISKYTTKGLAVEEDSLTLYSRFCKRNFTKNSEVLTNEFIAGTPDVIKEHVIDIKSSWDIFTFFRTTGKAINKQYYWQMQGYMALTGAKSATLAYCLTDTPDQIINDEKRRLLWKMGVLTDEDPAYIEACEKLDKLMTYSDIPLNERIIEIVIERNDKDILRIYNRAKECREYMKKELFKIA